MCKYFSMISPVVLQIQNEVGPEGQKLWVIPMLLLLLLGAYLLFRRQTIKKPGSHKKKFSLSLKRITVDLHKDRNFRPKVLILKVKNNRRKDVDIEAPVLVFRKLWSKRKFKLKGMNRYEIYPLYLEAGKEHELQINLSVFHEHDRSIRRFYWAKVFVFDTKGRKYSSKYVTLRKSLYS